MDKIQHFSTRGADSLVKTTKHLFTCKTINMEQPESQEVGKIFCLGGRMAILEELKGQRHFSLRKFYAHYTDLIHEGSSRPRQILWKENKHRSLTILSLNLSSTLIPSCVSLDKLLDHSEPYSHLKNGAGDDHLVILLK